jgi:sulfoxide reductase heme-binding subunit YedZ
VGMASFLLLIPIALTSFDIWKVRLGKNWKYLHQVAYFIAPLVILHYAWSKKGNILTLQGDIVRPFIYGLVLLLLLTFRIRPIRTFLASLRSRILALFYKSHPQPE